MEAAGLVVGTLALVGVFEDCITLLSQIGAAKSMEKDYKLLTTRLDFQRTLLLQWAERLKLYDVEKYDARLDDPALGHLIHQGFDCILQLLQDGHVLQQRYGMRPVDVQEATEASTAVSGRLMSRFRDKSLSLRFRHGPSVIQSGQIGLSHQPSSDKHTAKRTRCDSDVHQSEDTFVNKRTRRHSQKPQPNGSNVLPNDNRTCSPSPIGKIKWVIKDKEQFDSLIRKLSDLITDINKVVPPQKGDVLNHKILEHEIQELNNARELRMIMYSSIENDSLLFQKYTKLVLDHLWFRLIDDRQNNVTEAHSRTLEWAIHPPASGAVWDDLSHWLRCQGDIYWIHGKPGSGKSTLMKYLYDHPEVMSSLKKWAGNKKLTVASFFLWNVGSPEQSTQEGLARGLLYHVLKRNPALIPTLLPHMWQEAQKGAFFLKPPSKIEMKTAFEKLGTEITTGAFAFFIDGLDEFTGNHREGLSFVKSLATSSNIKLLVSSRPIDSCVAAFSSAPKLRLQDLTKPDIERYINDIVRSHPCVAEHHYLSNTTLEGLVNDLRSKADGVFLWVVLACRALLEGFEAYDSAEELQCRVDELPAELESLFRHILNSLPPRFLRQAAKLLRICYVDRSTKRDGGLPAIPLAWAHEKDMQIDELEDFIPCSDDEVGRKFTMLEGRLRSRCRGLLEARRVHNLRHSHGTVDFMHRTVFEFLDTPDIWEMDCLRIEDDKFHETTVLAYMACYEVFIQDTYAAADLALNHLNRVERNSPTHLPRTLNRLAFALMHSRTRKRNFFGPLQHTLSLGDASLILAVEFDLNTFVQGYDVRGFNARQKQCHNLLQHAFEKPLMYTKIRIGTYLSISATIVDRLIISGCSPAENITLSEEETTTPWEIWMTSEHTNNIDHADLENAAITVAMIRAGALKGYRDPDHATYAHPEDYRENLEHMCDDWLKVSDNYPDLQDRERMQWLCSEIMEAVAAGDESHCD